jgi:signal transduction histidine kinase
LSIAETELVRPLEPSREIWVGRLAALGTSSWLPAVCVAVCLAAAGFAASGASPEAWAGRVVLQLLVVGVPLSAGLYAVRSPLTAPFGIALLAVGFLWSLTALGESGDSVLYTFGRISTWLIFPGVAYLMLAFPDGRIRPGLDRLLFWGVLALSAVLFVGTAPFVAAFPPLTMWATCAADCPRNALFILDRQPGLLTGVILVREWLVMLLWAGLFVSMAARWRRASPLQRRVTGPLFAASIALGITHIGFHAARQLGAPAQLIVDLAWLWAISVVAVCAAVLFGMVWRRVLLSNTLVQLGTALRGSDRPSDVQQALADGLSDPTLELLLGAGPSGPWQDARGAAAIWPRTLHPGRVGTRLSEEPDDPQVVMVHDATLRDDPDLLAGVARMVLAVRRHEELRAELAAALRELDATERRASAAADGERQRIERDLHDGAQQRLVALRIRLAVLEDRLQVDPGRGMRELRDLGDEVDLTLHELRSFARGDPPAPLVDHGMLGALQALATRAPLPVLVEVDEVGRLPPAIEGALYFTCAEALQNAVKHAGDATRVTITLRRSDVGLSLEINDDGRGFAEGTPSGHGLRNMRERIADVGGTLTVGPRPDGGTSVVAHVPVPTDRPRSTAPSMSPDTSPGLGR